MRSTVSLSGEWTCVLDERDLGVRERWYSQPLVGTPVQLPGSLSAQRIGNPVTLATTWTGTIFDRSFFDDAKYAPYRKSGEIKIPFWLQPDTVFVGPAWYQRVITIPEEWRGRRLLLTLERTHWTTDVWCDDWKLGQGESLSTPHRFDLGASLVTGSHRLTIRIDNRLSIQVGENAHSVSDHTQGNWNGVIGRVELSSQDQREIADVQVYPSARDRCVRITGRLETSDGNRVEPAKVHLRISSGTTGVAELAVEVESKTGEFSGTLALGVQFELWDEFSPNLYVATATLDNGSARHVVFGIRDIEARGRHLILNGRRLFLRGTLDCCAYPLTGHPPMDVESWRRIFQTYRDHGLNHVRFHSWCPPEAAFAAADQLGMYLQVECAAWANAIAVLAFNSPAGIGDGAVIDAWCYREGERILREYGNHPSFLFFAQGNEPGGPYHAQYLASWVEHFRALDKRRWYTASAGWPELPQNQFHVIPALRIHQWGDGLNCRVNGQPPSTTADYAEEVAKREAPLISHEIGQWCAYPPLNDTPNYMGHLKAKNYEIFRDSFEANGLGAKLESFVSDSGKLQALLYKEEIEASLRTGDLAGFQLLGLEDFPGQGTAPVGVLDVFRKSKGYISPEQFRRFCGPTVLLARLSRRVFEVGDKASARFDISHFGPADLVDAKLDWHLCGSEGDVVGTGTVPVGKIRAGKLTELSSIIIDTRKLPAPRKYALQVSLGVGRFENSWEFWLYPKTNDGPANHDGFFTADVTQALTWAEQGKAVLLTVAGTQIAGEVALGFSTVFWNTWCTQRQAPHTLGLHCDPLHPALADFPSESHTNWHWWYILQGAGAMVLDQLPLEIEPIVTVIDDWFANRRLGLIFEAKVGGGKLLVCSAALKANDDPVSRQLLASLKAYVASGRFQPKVKVDAPVLRTLFRKP